MNSHFSPCGINDIVWWFIKRDFIHFASILSPGHLRLPKKDMNNTVLLFRLQVHIFISEVIWFFSSLDRNRNVQLIFSLFPSLFVGLQQAGEPGDEGVLCADHLCDECGELAAPGEGGQARRVAQHPHLRGAGRTPEPNLVPDLTVPRTPVPGAYV